MYALPDAQDGGGGLGETVLPRSRAVADRAARPMFGFSSLPCAQGSPPVVKDAVCPPQVSCGGRLAIFHLNPYQKENPMFRLLIISLFVTGLFAAGCTTEKHGPHHRGCHRVGANRAGRNNGVLHHHYAKPQAPVEAKKK